MSDRDPGSGDWPGTEWDEPGSSVFGPGRPRPPRATLRRRRPAGRATARPGPGTGRPRPAPPAAGPPTTTVGRAVRLAQGPAPARPARLRRPVADGRRTPALPGTAGGATGPVGPAAGPAPAQYRGDRRAGGPESPPPPGVPAEPGGREGGGFPLGLGALLDVAGPGLLPGRRWWSSRGSRWRARASRWRTSARRSPSRRSIRRTWGSTPGPHHAARGIPTPDEISEVVEAEVRDQAAQAAAGAVDSGKARYLKLYTRTLWLPVAGGVALAVLFSTVLAPKSVAMSLLLGTPAAVRPGGDPGGAAHGHRAVGGVHRRRPEPSVGRVARRGRAGGRARRLRPGAQELGEPAGPEREDRGAPSGTRRRRSSRPARLAAGRRAPCSCRNSIRRPDRATAVTTSPSVWAHR